MAVLSRKVEARENVAKRRLAMSRGSVVVTDAVVVAPMGRRRRTVAGTSWRTMFVDCVYFAAKQPIASTHIHTDGSTVIDTNRV